VVYAPRSGTIRTSAPRSYHADAERVAALLILRKELAMRLGPTSKSATPISVRTLDQSRTPPMATTVELKASALRHPASPSITPMNMIATSSPRAGGSAIPFPETADQMPRNTAAIGRSKL
jgi:hypothetical protein